MKIGIVADTHDRLRYIHRAVEIFNNSGVQLVLHGGDFVAPFALSPLTNLKMDWLGVLGNNDGEVAGLTKMSEGRIRGRRLEHTVDGRSILVVHDELDLPPGTVRLKKGGGHGGHNGLRDLIAQLGSKDFHRLRIGIGHPGHRDQVVDYVLRKPGQDDRALIEQAIDDALEVMPMVIDGRMDKAMHRLHTRNSQAE